MHELSIALGIIDVAGEELDRQGGGAVVSVHVRVGALSGVVAHALLSAFELAREGSALARSRLEIEDVPVALFCPQCRCVQPAESPWDLRCGTCGAFAADVVAGRELEVIAMEIET